MSFDNPIYGEGSEDQPIMSIEDFDTAIAGTCGPVGCMPVQLARHSILLVTDPSTLISFDTSGIIPEAVLEQLRQGTAVVLGPSGEPVDPDELQESISLNKKSAIESAAKVARGASYFAGTIGKICMSGPQHYINSTDKSKHMTVCGRGDDEASHKSQCPEHGQQTTLAEVRVTIQRPPQKRH